MNVSIPNCNSKDTHVKYPKCEHLEAAEKWINHYTFLEQQKMRRVENLHNFGGKKKKYNYKKMEYQAIVLRAIKKHSLKNNDKRRLKIRLWPRRDECGNKIYNEAGIVEKIERYDIMAFVRMLVAAKSISDDIFNEFLSIYDVRQIMDNIMEDYFGDLKLFLNKKTL